MAEMSIKSRISSLVMKLADKLEEEGLHDVKKMKTFKRLAKELKCKVKDLKKSQHLLTEM